jgi:hypothetical protein
LLIVPFALIYGTIFDINARYYYSNNGILQNRLSLSEGYIFNFVFANTQGKWDINGFDFTTDTLRINDNKLYFKLGDIGYNINSSLVYDINNIIGFQLCDYDYSKNIEFGAYYKNSFLHPTSLFIGGLYKFNSFRTYFRLSTENLFSTEIGVENTYIHNNYKFNSLIFLNPSIDSIMYISPGLGFNAYYNNDWMRIGVILKYWYRNYHFLYHFYPCGYLNNSIYFSIYSSQKYYLYGGLSYNNDFSNFFALSHYISQRFNLNNNTSVNSTIKYYIYKRNLDKNFDQQYIISNKLLYRFPNGNISLNIDNTFFNNYFNNQIETGVYWDWKNIMIQYSLGYLDDNSLIYNRSGIFNMFYIKSKYKNISLATKFKTINNRFERITGELSYNLNYTTISAVYSWSNAYNNFYFTFRTRGIVEDINFNYLRGYVFYDKNNNHIYDKEDIGESDIGIYIDGKLRGISKKSGRFIIPFISPGKHTISIGVATIPAYIGTDEGAKEILISRFGFHDINLPLFKLGSISGKVFYDANMNGFYDEGEKGLPKAVVEMAGRWTITDENGNYILANLIPGQYILSISTIPEGYRISIYNLRMIIYLKQGSIIKDIDFGIVKKEKTIIMKEF